MSDIRKPEIPQRVADYSIFAKVQEGYESKEMLMWDLDAAFYKYECERDEKNERKYKTVEEVYKAMVQDFSYKMPKGYKYGNKGELLSTDEPEKPSIPKNDPKDLTDIITDFENYWTAERLIPYYKMKTERADSYSEAIKKLASKLSLKADKELTLKITPTKTTEKEGVGQIQHFELSVERKNKRRTLFRDMQLPMRKPAEVIEIDTPETVTSAITSETPTTTTGTSIVTTASMTSSAEEITTDTATEPISEVTPSETTITTTVSTTTTTTMATATSSVAQTVTTTTETPTTSTGTKIAETKTTQAHKEKIPPFKDIFPDKAFIQDDPQQIDENIDIDERRSGFGDDDDQSGSNVEMESDVENRGRSQRRKSERLQKKRPATEKDSGGSPSKRQRSALRGKNIFMSLRKVFEFSEEEPTIKETASRGELLDYYSRIMEYVEDCQKQKQHELDDEGKERLEKMRIAIDKYFSEEYPQCEELDVPPEGKADDETLTCDYTFENKFLFPGTLFKMNPTVAMDEKIKEAQSLSPEDKINMIIQHIPYLVVMLERIDVMCRRLRTLFDNTSQIYSELKRHKEDIEAELRTPKKNWPPPEVKQLEELNVSLPFKTFEEIKDYFSEEHEDLAHREERLLIECINEFDAKAKGNQKRGIKEMMHRLLDADLIATSRFGAPNDHTTKHQVIPEVLRNFLLYNVKRRMSEEKRLNMRPSFDSANYNSHIQAVFTGERAARKKRKAEEERKSMKMTPEEYRDYLKTQGKQSDNDDEDQDD